MTGRCTVLHGAVRNLSGWVSGTTGPAVVVTPRSGAASSGADISQVAEPLPRGASMEACRNV